MKLKGQIQGREVVILIDCGATHNFIAQSLLEELKLPYSETTHYGVIMGTGLTVKREGICKGVVLELLELTVKEDFLPLELGSLDVVLGMQWLKRMGTMKVDWPALLMTFKRDGRKIQLKGDPSLTQKEVTFKRLSRAWDPLDQGFLVELRAITTVDGDGSNEAGEQFPDVPMEVKNLLTEFDTLFRQPDELPPSRAINHRIQLKEGEQPVNVRSYRYAHAQKAEIERLVGEMLATGIIRPNISPYSSHVILVKKKDGS